MKKLIIVLLVLGMVGLVSEAKAEWNFSITALGGWDRATWDSGSRVAPEGKQTDDAFAWMIAGQMRTDVIKLPLKLQPTIEISYMRLRHDFSTPTAIQKTHPQEYTFLFGLTREWKWLNGYVLAGATFYEINLTMRDASGRHPKSHTGWSPVIDLGIYKPITLWDRLTIAPEIKAYIYPVRPSMERCRDYHEGYVKLFGGIRLEW